MPCFCTLLAAEERNRHVDPVKGEVCHVVNCQYDRLLNIFVLSHLFFGLVDQRCNGIDGTAAAKTSQKDVWDTAFCLRARNRIDFDLPIARRSRRWFRPVSFTGDSEAL